MAITDGYFTRRTEEELQESERKKREFEEALGVLEAEMSGGVANRKDVEEARDTYCRRYFNCSYEQAVSNFKNFYLEDYLRAVGYLEKLERCSYKLPKKK